MFLPRSQWSFGQQPNWTRMPGPQPDVFIHHVGGPCPPAASISYAQQFEAMAIAAGVHRGDHYIATEYHIGVFLNGDEVEFRPNGVQGGATLNHNTNSYSIVLMGNFDNQQVTPAMIATVQRRIAQWKAGGQLVPNPNIRPHSAVFATACPGNNARAVLPQFSQSPQPQGDDMFEDDDRKKLTQVRDALGDLAEPGVLHTINNFLVSIDAEIKAIKAKTDKLP